MVRDGDRLSMCVRLRTGGACSNGYVAYTQGRRIRGRNKEVPYLDVYQQQHIKHFQQATHESSLEV